jgi:serine phosphatase RsbU (regulator of sigma subunit)
MDIALCAIDTKKRTLEYAGANNPLYIIRNGELIQTKPDKLAIGGIEHDDQKYTTQTIQLEKGDVFYVFSDGYADQFGGPKGKKFMYKQFKETLCNIALLNLGEQKAKLDEIIEHWKGSYEQVDDILVIGAKV